MPALQVRLADLTNPADAQATVDLLDMYSRDAFGDSAPLSAEARANLIPGLLQHGGARVFLARLGEADVGLAICLKGFSSFRGKPLLNIHDLAVAPGHRGAGIGAALLRAVSAQARAEGCCRVTLEVRSDNVGAMTLYRREGFAPSEPDTETFFWMQKLE